MAKKSTTETQAQEVVMPVETDNVEATVNRAIEVPVNETEIIKPRIIIANTSVPFRKAMSLETKYITGHMSVGTAYEIVKECSSKIYGDFYKLNNGYYVVKNGNYSIS